MGFRFLTTEKYCCHILKKEEDLNVSWSIGLELKVLIYI